MGNIGGVDTNWFKGRIADRRLSQRQMATRMGLDPAAMSLMLRGKRKMSASEAAEVSRLLNVDVDEVLRRAGIGRPVVTTAPSSAPKTQQPAQHTDAGVTLELPVPMSDGATAKLLLPRNLNKADADRIAALVRAIALPE